MSETFITSDQLAELTHEFHEELIYPTRQARQQHLIVIGGGPGSGKTTAARKMAGLANSWHVQSNSARWLLSQHNLPYGQNVHSLVHSMIKRLLDQGSSVTLDGMLTEREERDIIRELAFDYGVPVFCIAIMCRPAIAEQRAVERYKDSAPSRFEDWRCKPEKFQEYLKSIRTLTAKLEDNLTDRFDDPSEGILRLSNNSKKDGLLISVGEAWQMVSDKYLIRL